MKQRKVQKLEDLLEQNPTGPITQKDLYSLRYKESLRKARASKLEEDIIEKLNIRTGNYSLRTRILKSPWVSQRPASKAVSWMYKTVFQNPSIYRYNRRLMFQGGLFMFDYLNPKYAGTSVLPWFDKYPLVLSLGPKETNQGIRNLGFNLHLLPPKIRIVVLCAIFELYKKLYRWQIFTKREEPVSVDYHMIVNNLQRFGVGFSVRMYIPARQRQIVRFPYKDWSKAIFLPSRAYDGIRSAQLIKEWKQYCRKNGVSISPNLDWKSQI